MEFEMIAVIDPRALEILELASVALSGRVAKLSLVSLEGTRYRQQIHTHTRAFA